LIHLSGFAGGDLATLVRNPALAELVGGIQRCACPPAAPVRLAALLRRVQARFMAGGACGSVGRWFEREACQQQWLDGCAGGSASGSGQAVYAGMPSAAALEAL